MDNEKVEKYLKKFETFFPKNHCSKKGFLMNEDIVRKLIKLLMLKKKEYILSDFFIDEMTSSFYDFVDNIGAINDDFDRGIFNVIYKAIVNVYSSDMSFNGRYVRRSEEKIKYYDLAIINRLQEAAKIIKYAYYKFGKSSDDMNLENIILALLLSKCIADNNLSSFSELGYCFAENIPFILDDLILNGLIKGGLIENGYDAINRVIQKIEDNEVEVQIT